MAVEAALLDVDGTLIDSNYHHALAWYRAFRRHDIVLPLWRIHRAVGMGGDQLVPALVGSKLDKAKGDDIRAARDEIYTGGLIDEVAALEGAHELIAWTTKDDVEATKPEPDLILAALEKAQTESAVMVGDTPWDVKAASKAGVETLCVITGGWSKQELREAGAIAVFESVDELRQRLEETPLI